MQCITYSTKSCSISAGVCLQTLVLASLLRPFSYYESQASRVSSQSEHLSDESAEEISLILKDAKVIGLGLRVLHQLQFKDY